MDTDGTGEWPGEGLPDDAEGDLGSADDPLAGSDSSFDGLSADDPMELPGDDIPAAGDDSEYGWESESDLPADTVAEEAVAGLADEPVTEDVSDNLVDAVPGTDPDADPLADEPEWQSDPFPEALQLEAPPEPVDGMPWSDPSLLGGPDTEPLSDPTTGVDASPPVSELYEYDGTTPDAEGADAWRTLAGSDDPATSSLARFWGSGA